MLFVWEGVWSRNAREKVSRHTLVSRREMWCNSVPGKDFGIAILGDNEISFENIADTCRKRERRDESDLYLPQTLAHHLGSTRAGMTRHSLSWNLASLWTSAMNVEF